MKYLLWLFLFLPTFGYAITPSEVVDQIQQSEKVRGFDHTRIRIEVFLKAFFVTVHTLNAQGKAVAIENHGRYYPRESYNGFCRNPKNPWGDGIPCLRWRSVQNPVSVGDRDFLEALKATAPSQQFSDVEIARHVKSYIDVLFYAMNNGDKFISRGFGTYYTAVSLQSTDCGAKYRRLVRFRPSEFLRFTSFSPSPHLNDAVN